VIRAIVGASSAVLFGEVKLDGALLDILILKGYRKWEGKVLLG